MIGNSKNTFELKSQMLKRFQFPAHFDLFSFRFEIKATFINIFVVVILLCLNRGSHYRLLMTFYF